MILYYSGAAQYKQFQPYPSKSLGGYMSNSPVPNGQIGSIFSSLTRDVNWQNDCRMIVLYNSTGFDVTNIQISTIANSKYIDYKIAVVAPAIDQRGCPIFESIQFSNQLPTQANLENHDSDNPIQVDELKNCKCIGIWLQRSLKEIDPSETDYVYKLLSNQAITCEDAENYGPLDMNSLKEIVDPLVLNIGYEFAPTTTTTTTA